METTLTPTMEEEQRIVVRCRCGLPCAYILDGNLVIESRHHGEIHSNRIPLANLAEMLKAE